MNVEAQQYCLNDIDCNVIMLHKFLHRSSLMTDIFFPKIESIIKKYGLSCSYKKNTIPDTLKHQYPKTYFAKYNKAPYSKLKSDFNSKEEKSMYDLYILLIYGFNRMLRFNRRGEFNLPVGNVDFNKNVILALKSYFDRVKTKHPTWFNFDYKVFLEKLDLKSRDFVYLDPPYLITFSEYNKLWNEQKEIELLSLLDTFDKRKIKFAISNVTNYKGRTNCLFVKWANKYNSHPIKSNYINFHDNSVKQFAEVLITNY